jgi:hypothetical protein
MIAIAAAMMNQERQFVKGNISYAWDIAKGMIVKAMMIIRVMIAIAHAIAAVQKTGMKLQ